MNRGIVFGLILYLTSSVIWGQVADKYGTKWFGLAGAISMSLTLLALSSLDSIYQFYLLYFLFGALGSALLFSPLYANVGFWFRKNPGFALGIAASGGAVGLSLLGLITSATRTARTSPDMS